MLRDLRNLKFSDKIENMWLIYYSIMNLLPKQIRNADSITTLFFFAVIRADILDVFTEFYVFEICSRYMIDDNHPFYEIDTSLHLRIESLLYFFNRRFK